jgi:8-oxo-dGTP diphosphatase
MSEEVGVDMNRGPSNILLVVAVALYCKTTQKFLLCKRPPGKPMAGMWEFPGGKIEPGETPEEAATRELYEEIDIHIHTDDLEIATFASHSYPDFHLLMPVYVCRTWQGEAKPNEGQTLGWFSFDEIDHLEMPPPDGPLLKQLRQNLTDS